MKRNREAQAPHRRNVVVYNMMMRSQKAGTHGDVKKEASKKACRGKVKA